MCSCGRIAPTFFPAAVNRAYSVDRRGNPIACESQTVSIFELEAVVPPPASESPVEPSAWSEAERRIGTPLPKDYRDLVDRYGAGRFSDFLSVFTPFSGNPHADLLVQMDRQLASLRELRANGEHAPYPIFPEPGGLLPFAITDNGDVLHWATNGPPDAWRVVVNEARSPVYELHDTDMTGFIAGLLSKSRESAILPRGLAPRFSRFAE